MIKLKRFSVNIFASLLAVLYPFFDYYGFGFITLSFLGALLFFIYTIKKRGYFAIVQPAAMICYFLYFCATRVLSNIEPMTSLRAIIAPSTIFIFLLNGLLNKEVILKYFLIFYRLAVFINIIFLFVQESMYFATGYRVLGILPFLPLTNIGGSDFEATQYAELASMAERSSAFFSEPAHFVQFLLPLLAIELFYVGGKYAYIRSFIYILTLLVLSSGNALLGIGVIGIFVVIKILKQLHPLLGIITVLIFIGIASFSVNLILRTEYGKDLMDRSIEIDPNREQNSSGFIRIFRGYFIWDEMTEFEKMIGINSVAKIDTKIRQCSAASTFGENDRYMNAVQSVIIYTGYIGTLIFIFLLISLWRHNNLAGRCCIVIYIALSFIARIYFTYTMALYFLVAWLMKKENSPSNFKSLRIKFI